MYTTRDFAVDRSPSADQQRQSRNAAGKDSGPEGDVRMNNHVQPGSRAKAPPTARGGAGPPAPLLIDGEDVAEYDTVCADIVGRVKPADVLEELCAREVADLVWEVKRLRRLKVTLIRSTMRRLLQETLRPIIYSDRQPGSASEDYPNERALAVGWAAGEQKAVDRVKKRLGSFGSSVESVVAQAMASRMVEIERTDRMIVMAEQRRAAALRAVEGRRAQLAAEPCRVASEIEKGEEEARPQSSAAPQGAAARAQPSSST